MYVNRDHLRFNPAMEVLCMLPVAPVALPIQTIADDLGLTNKLVHKIVGNLQVRYGGIHRPARGMVSVDSGPGLVGIRQKAQGYWNRVYGDTPCPTTAPSPTL